MKKYKNQENLPPLLSRKILFVWGIFVFIVLGIVFFTLCDQASPAHAGEISILAQDPPTEKMVTMQFRVGGRFVWEGKKILQKTPLSELPDFWREFSKKVGVGKICAVLYECDYGEVCVRFTDTAVQDLYNMCYYGE
jgi:hypothetical protein